MGTSAADIAVYILSVLLVLEFSFAPVNLISGRNAPLFREFTGIKARTPMLVVAGIDAVGAVLVAVGVFVRPIGIAGAALLTALCAWYLLIMTIRQRHFGAGLFAFLLFGGWAVGLLFAQLAR